MLTVSIIGAGYVGLVTGACLAELGNAVACVEIDPIRLRALERGELPIHEPGLSELVVRHRQTGRLRFTDDYATAIPDAAFVFIAVPTPSGPSGEANTDFVFSAVLSVLRYARPGLVIVTKSTVPVGTGDQIARLARSAGVSAAVVANPEFLREGSAVQDFLQPDRIVVGADRHEAGVAVAQLYAALDAPVIHCSRRSAELAKYAANAFLATRISFMNEMAAICEATAADIDEVAGIVGMDPRIGPAFLKAGIGWGGSCFPKDVRALAATASSCGCRPSILDAVYDVNARQRERAFVQLRAAVATAADPTVGVLGLAFKPGTDDIRESPALDIVGRLVEEGIRVRAHDPLAMANARRVLPNIEYCRDAYDVAHGSDALLLATEWRDYMELDWTRIGTLMRHRVVLDGRNALQGSRLVALGFTYRSFGRAAAMSGAARSAERQASDLRGLQMEPRRA